MATPDNSSRALPSWLLFGGLVALFIGERLVGSGPIRWFSALGAVLVMAAIGLRAARTAGAAGDRRQAERTLLGLAALSAVAMVFYALQSDLATSFLDRPLDRSSPKLAKP